MTRFFRSAALTGALLLICSCRSTVPVVPVVPLQLDEGDRIQTITQWRVIGPFRVADSKALYTPAMLQEAFDRDYLPELGGSEAPLALRAPTTNRPVDFQHDPNDRPDLSPAEVQFIDQVQQFPVPPVNTQVLFWRAGEFFKVTYGAVSLSSEVDTEAALIVSGNSPVKVWLNDRELFQSPASAIGHDPDVLHLLTVPLKKGTNNLLVKMFCFPKRNEFVVRLATRERALTFVREHGGLRDVVEQVIVPAGQPLSLSSNLRFFAAAGGGALKFEIADGARTLRSEVCDPGPCSEIRTHDLAPGLYTVTASAGEWCFSENFYLGEREKVAEAYEGRCATSGGARGRPPELCALAPILKEHATHLRSSFRLDWQKRALFLIEQLEANLPPPPDGGPTLPEPQGVRVFAYRSRVDGQTQYYFLHLPKGHDGRKVPLVIVNPHNTVQKPFLSGPVASNLDLLRRGTTYADEFGYACLWTNGRGRNNNVHLALTDTFEALEDVRRRFAIDDDRIYLTGDCGGARNALLLAERFPDRIAAVSILNAATSSGLTANELWREGNSPRAAAGNLLNIPLQLIHGEHFPHSPMQQSLTLREECRRAGIEPELLVLPGDTRWAEQDPLRLSFAFFQGKVRQTPRAVALAAGQLKYGSAYWLRVTELATPPALGRLNARFGGANQVTVTTDNISELELLPERFPADVPRRGALEVTVNGTPQTIQMKDAQPIKLRILPAGAGGAAQKTETLEGPVAHAFAEPFIVVQSSGGSPLEQKTARGLADQLERAWQDNYFVPLQRKTVDEVTATDLVTKNLVITGGPNVEQTLERMFGPLPFELNADYVRIGDETIESKRAVLSAVYPNPRNPRLYLVLVATNIEGEVGLPAPELARSGSYDVAVWKLNAAGNDSQLLGEWYWDNSWSRLMPAGAVGGDADAVEGN